MIGIITGKLGWSQRPHFLEHIDREAQGMAEEIFRELLNGELGNFKRSVLERLRSDIEREMNPTPK